MIIWYLVKLGMKLCLVNLLGRCLRIVDGMKYHISIMMMFSGGKEKDVSFGTLVLRIRLENFKLLSMNVIMNIRGRICLRN